MPESVDEAMDEMEAPEASRVRRLLPLGGGVAVVALIAFGLYSLVSKPSDPPRKIVPELKMVKIQPLPPPPPPPPPPPKEPPPPEPQKMVEAPKIPDPVKPERPQEAPKQAAPAPPGPLGLDAKGEGPGDAFGLQGHPGGSDITGGGGGGGSLSGWYGSVVATALYQAVNRDGRLEHASGDIKARIWLAADGTPTKVELMTSFGDPKLDHAFEDIVLHGLRLSDPPPKELPEPVVIRLRAQPPSRS